jgi:NTP pyrophosphatase (non-canonical NTP hydrolase)
MQNKQQEILLITQEECAEVTQAISKVFRFGIDGEHNGISNRERLEEELGDLQCMIDLLISEGLISQEKMWAAHGRKLDKLKKWSNIFKEKVSQ